MLFPSDDPYMSDRDFHGCFLAITHWPLDRQRRLTYGNVDDALKGAWEFLYRGGRYVTADFFIDEEGKGTVGFGRIFKDAPTGLGAVSIKE